MSEVSIRTEIRARLMRFLNRREKAYKAILKQGFAIPGYKDKIDAIKSIRVQLRASENWSLDSHYKWISAMRDKLTALLPSEFNDDPNQVTYRKVMRELICFCDDQVNSKPLFKNSNSKAA